MNLVKPFLFLQLMSLPILSSCISSVGSIDKSLPYSQNYNSIQETNLKVESVQRDFIWTPCNILAEDIINDLKMRAKNAGGDTITNVLFYKDGIFMSDIPVCEKQFGWFLLYFVPGLGPWAQVTRANVSRYIHSNNKSNYLNKSKNTTSNCASLVTGSKEKLVCGDSKDRVLEKWGNPTLASPSQGQWRYDSCIIEFLDGKLNNYGGQCDFSKISNDSFTSSRIELSQNDRSIHELNTELKNCLKVDIGETLETTLALMGKPNSMERNDVSLSNNKCLENFANPKFSLKCSDTIMSYLYSKNQKECKLYLKNKKIFYIDKNCPISCSLFE
ncbi:hypothetical protein QEJ31_07290 [Pigmentibacter sp. JX0631]|uniref:hypothetical protein n=1 Tax=Pigmentibacter sp. JX0631 TaxID=2976982 RepID=UPI002469415B|nr:hypothetical protein [Pigmentibacter sp. JX0631]WGL61394.1 hypothetical protein QEJ31_07290 [Pigmentibacter sp. JX0631]